MLTDTILHAWDYTYDHSLYEMVALNTVLERMVQLEIKYSSVIN